MSTTIERISLIALTGIFIAIFSLFSGRRGQYNNSISMDINKNQDTAKTHLDSARLYFEKNDYVLLISEYRKTIEIEPNYIDEKSKVFLGDEIKNAIKKTIFELTAKEKINPDDKIVKQGLKDAYYLRRRFGRGCE